MGIDWVLRCIERMMGNKQSIMMITHHIAWGSSYILNW